MKLHEVISKNLILGDPITVHGLGIIPLIGDSVLDLPPIDLLEHALDGGTLKITEVSEGGAVPFFGREQWVKARADPGWGRIGRRQAEPDRQHQHHNPPRQDDGHSRLVHGSGPLEQAARGFRVG